MKNYDLVVLHRKLLDSVGWHVLRRSCKRLAYDFDDALMFKDSKSAQHYSRRRTSRFNRIVRGADFVIAGNEYLKTFAAKENKRTSIIPTSIDMCRYEERPAKAASNQITLGWIGSRSTLFYLERMKHVWDALYDRYPQLRLMIVSNAFFDCDRMPVTKKAWSYEEEIGDLHTFDIGVMPLTDDVWARGKCGFKLLQYMAVGVPAVCSPVGMNKEIVADGTNGFWAESEEEWVDKVGRLIEDPQLRADMGRRARETVIERYSAEVSSKKMVELFTVMSAI
ncbi:MAG: glycosyltransferase family 4 protein [Nitrospirota bacterium]